MTSHGGKIVLFLLFSGLLLWGETLILWQSIGFGPLDYATTMKVVIPGAMLISLSFEMLIFIFFRSWIRVEINS